MIGRIGTYPVEIVLHIGIWIAGLRYYSFKSDTLFIRFDYLIGVVVYIRHTHFCFFTLIACFVLLFDIYI